MYLSRHCLMVSGFLLPLALPVAAESWNLPEDQMSRVFTLRQDAKWSDGVAVTAHDAVSAFSCWPDPEKKQAVKSSPIVGFAPNDERAPGVTALDDNTLKIDMVKPLALDLPVPEHHDPTAGKALLEEAGYSESNRLQLTISCNLSEANWSIVELQKEDLARAHIDVVIDPDKINRPRPGSAVFMPASGAS